MKKLKKVEFKITSSPVVDDKLYLDLVRFKDSINKQSRDVVVRHIGPYVDPLSRNSNVNPTLHDDKDFWQQSLRWYDATAARSTEPLTDIEDKILEVDAIEDRLENWYVKVGDSLGSLAVEDTDITTDSNPAGGYDFEAAKQKRWQSLLTSIEQAHDYYGLLRLDQKKPTLFAKVSEYGAGDFSSTNNDMTKFGFIFANVLLPLSIEYSLMSRETEIQSFARNHCSSLISSDDPTFQKGITNVAGRNSDMRTAFLNIVNPQKGTITCVQTNKRIVPVEDLIKQLNTIRFGRISKVLDHLEEQGWAEGSGVGSLDHEMNKAGSGFMNSMFLLRKNLRTSNKLQKLLKTMKWYNDFNEIYQPDNDMEYVYDGTTADRMRTTLLYRLMIILIQPSDAAHKEQKIHDMNHYRTWTKHILKINKGLGGVIKPDYTSFHHKTFYGSAYAPHALHNAALVQYLLSGTSFALEQKPKDNLRKALAVLRTVAVKYSTPESICGRFPKYDQAILAQHIPAYAYISYVASGANSGTLDKPEMFLRLFDASSPSVEAYLENGQIFSGIYYWNTIGSLDILKKVKTLQCPGNTQCVAEASPHGHWSKNFAALSIHRRQDWSVAAKGFNKYTWDYESSPKENIYGVFHSHGSLQISNSEESLKAYDVEKGWDWTRIPGTTTVKLEIENLVCKARNYNHKTGSFAGGVSFKGSNGNRPQHGAFGMALKNIKYTKKSKKSTTTSPILGMNFEFKKSYFFYNNLIVCVGSDITLSNVDTNTYAQTTLFQDKQRTDPTQPAVSTITINGITHNLGTMLNKKSQWGTAQTVLLKDTNGNTYQVKNAEENGLNVQISSQSSKNGKGKDTPSTTYATAWLQHDTGGNGNAGANGNTANKLVKYEYAILVNGEHSTMFTKYRVTKKDSKVHSVQLSKLPGRDQQIKVYGYSFFEVLESTETFTDGPVKSTSAPCMIMVEQGPTTLHLSISNPSITFRYDPRYSSKDMCTRKGKREIDDIFSPKASQEVGVKMMFCVEGEKSTITVSLNHDVGSITSVKVEGKDKDIDDTYASLVATDSKQVNFSNLANGFTTEVVLQLI